MDTYEEKRVAECLDAEEKLTQWEFEFLMRLAGRPSEPLSDRQREKLDEIAHKVNFG